MTNRKVSFELRASTNLKKAVYMRYKGVVLSESGLDFTFTDSFDTTVKQCTFMLHDKHVKVKYDQYPKGSMFVFESNRRGVDGYIHFTLSELQYFILVHEDVDHHRTLGEFPAMEQVILKERQFLPKRPLSDIVIRLLGVYRHGEVIVVLSRYNPDNIVSCRYEYFECV